MVVLYNHQSKRKQKPPFRWFFNMQKLHFNESNQHENRSLLCSDIFYF